VCGAVASQWLAWMLNILSCISDIINAQLFGLFKQSIPL